MTDEGVGYLNESATQIQLLEFYARGEEPTVRWYFDWKRDVRDHTPRKCDEGLQWTVLRVIL